MAEQTETVTVSGIQTELVRALDAFAEETIRTRSGAAAFIFREFLEEWKKKKLAEKGRAK